jgi:hypothetical protein
VKRPFSGSEGIRIYVALGYGRPAGHVYFKYPHPFRTNTEPRNGQTREEAYKKLKNGNSYFTTNGEVETSSSYGRNERGVMKEREIEGRYLYKQSK